jgi:hypothetical protein
MAQYEADKIIQLLRFCSWKGKTDLKHTGLMELTAKLGALPDSDQQTPNEKYLVDLYSDANTALKKDNFVLKRESYIRLLLQYAGFATWDDWKNALPVSREYLDFSKVDLATLSELKVGVVYSDAFQKELLPLLTNIRGHKDYAFQLEEQAYKEDVPSSYAPQIIQQLEKYAVILWVIPVGWKDQPNQMKQPTWQELMDGQRIIPVWIHPDDPWQTIRPNIPALKQTIVHGIQGVLISLLGVQELLNGILNTGAIAKKEAVKPFLGHQFNDHSSGFFNHGNVSQTIQHIGSQHYTTDKNISV